MVTELKNPVTVSITYLGQCYWIGKTKLFPYINPFTLPIITIVMPAKANNIVLWEKVRGYNPPGWAVTASQGHQLNAVLPPWEHHQF